MKRLKLIFKIYKKNVSLFLLVLFLCLFFSCVKTKEEKIAVIWTDRVDFVSYSELFNSSQNKFKVVVEFKENPAGDLINTKTPPDIVIGPWLKGKAARANLKSIGNIFGKDKIQKQSFYPELLNLGNIDGTQYLLPVSFNLPMIIFSAENKFLVKNDFTLSLSELKEISASFSKLKKGSHQKMGFSPRWSDEFLYATAKGFGASFEEDSDFFKWVDVGLQKAVDYVRNWSATENQSPKVEDEFKFKYLYDLPHIVVQNGRCLFYYMSSEELFSIRQEKLTNIDFRWLSFNGKTPLNDDIVYAGICRGAKNSKAAYAFFEWLFNEHTQKQILDRSAKMNLMITSFGFAGGFSALRSVTEKFLPRYYPLMLAHLPQTRNIYTPNILPSNWPKLKKELLMPYLKEACDSGAHQNRTPSLNKKITDWYKNK